MVHSRTVLTAFFATWMASVLAVPILEGNALAARVAEGYSPVSAQSSPSDYVHRPRAEQALSEEDEKMISYLESNGHTNGRGGLRSVIRQLKEDPNNAEARSMVQQFYKQLTQMDKKGLSSTP
ncbi:hypothetical protein C8J55DRAFT_567399 [Lentinula edodes]|uniref:RxLR effector protein n=1 Tax=Lentinula lateritia TaxID=40482 RepID=A0A9W8ZPQ5_9AGAR|nr:hypothetical protein C8J55DRAFT_567399 [Lentinula edodes]